MKRYLLAAVATGAIALATSALADDYQPAKAGTWIVDLRGSGVLPSGTDAITTAAGAATGLSVKATDDYKPTLGLTYFFTDHIAVEAILGTTQHTIRAVGPGVDLAVRDTWVLPPVVTLQYRPLPASRLNPYVGAGVNYMLFYGGSNKNGFVVKTPSGFGWAVQAGADIAVEGPWTLNADVKKVFFETNAKINGGAMYSHVHLDPMVVSLGFGRKF
jgi:outer membrane protein